MLAESSWSTVPVDVLRRAFELQPDGLDNCAASITCKAWRAALTSSAAGTIYLYATADSQEQRWQRLLSSRSSIKSLKLVRAASWSSSSDWYTIQRSKQIAQDTIDSIPMACRALTLSEFCSHHLAQYAQKAPQLEQLSFEWAALPFEGFDEMRTMPDLTPLCHLTQLEVKMQNDVHGDMFSQLINCCPDSVQSLKLHGFGSELDGTQPPPFSLQSLSMLEHCLPALTHLELDDCIVTIPGEDITCLSKLSSLSLVSSEVYVDGALEVDRLTALTYLDLTDTTCYWEDAWIEVLDTFTAWPGLRILKTRRCNLFDSGTRIVLGAVAEAYVSCPILLDCTMDSHLQLHMSSSLLYVKQPFESMSAKHIDATQKLVADLKVHSSSFQDDAAQNFVQQLSTDFPNLRSLEVESDVQATVHVSDVCTLSNLTDLHLHNVCCLFDLQSLSSLTHLHLCCNDASVNPNSVMLPSSLQALTFVGHCLFDTGTEHNLLDLACLSKVVLSWQNIGPLSLRPRLPRLPHCVTHLTLATSATLQHEMDWTNSNGCQSVQHLTLELPPALGDPLSEWVRSLPRLQVLDYTFPVLQNQSLMPASDSNSPLRGTRLPKVHDIPDWLDDPHLLGALM